MANDTMKKYLLVWSGRQSHSTTWAASRVRVITSRVDFGIRGSKRPVRTLWVRGMGKTEERRRTKTNGCEWLKGTWLRVGPRP